MYFHKQWRNFDSSVLEEEFQHSNFGYVRFSQRTYYHPNWKNDSSDFDNVSKTDWDIIRNRQYQKMIQRSNQTNFSINHPSLEKNTQHVDQPSICLQEPNNRLVSYT